jgi:hypothetical protein
VTLPTPSAKVGPVESRDARLGRNEALFRSVNERLERLNEAFSTVTERFEIVCECAKTDCGQRIPIPVEAYECARDDPSLFLLVPGHEDANVEEVVERHETYHVVRKHDGAPREAAEEMDPRA